MDSKATIKHFTFYYVSSQKLLGLELKKMSLISVVHLYLRISPRIFEKFETVLIGYSGARGKLIHEKHSKQKTS